MAAQQGAWQKRCKVHKDLSQQRRHLLQGPFQLCSNAVEENASREKSQKKSEQKWKGGNIVHQD